MFVLPDFINGISTVAELGSIVLAGLAVMWVARKLVRTVNRS